MTSPTNDRVANFNIKAHTIKHAIRKKLIKDKQITNCNWSVNQHMCVWGGWSSESLIIK